MTRTTGISGIILSSVLLLHASLSCTVQEPEFAQGRKDRDTVRVSLSCDVPTRSAVFDSENENGITSLTVIAYRTGGGDYTNDPFSGAPDHFHPEVAFRRMPEFNFSGTLITEKTFHSTEGMTLDLPVTGDGESIHLYAVANLPGFHGTIRERDLQTATYRYSSAASMGTSIPMVMEESYEYVQFNPSGFPKYYTVTGYKPFKSFSVSGTGVLNISLTMNKAVARYRFTLNNGLAGHLRTASIRIRQAPLVIAPFMHGYRAGSPSDVGDGDWGSSSDVRLCEGQPVNFYCLENMQGTIPQSPVGGGWGFKPDEWGKVPANNVRSDVCTYLELVGFMDGSLDGKVGDVTYRFYLGKDNVDNYDVERNTSYDISLAITEGGLSRTSWKITDDRTEFSTGGDIFIAQRLTYPVTPENGTVLSLALGSTVTDDGRVRIRPVTNASGQVVGCEVSARAAGTSTVYVKNGGTTRKTMDLTVRAPKVVCDSASMSLTVDGTSRFLSYRYVSPTTNEELPRSVFDGALYAELLSCTVSHSSPRFGAVLSSPTSGRCEVYISSFGGATSAAQLTSTLTVRPASASVTPATVFLYALDPFPADVGEDTNKGKLYYDALDRDGYQWAFLKVPVNAPTVRAEFYLGGSAAGTPLTELQHSYNPATGLLSIGCEFRHVGADGVHTVKLSVTNFRSGENWTSSSRTFTFTKIINVYICGTVTMRTGTDGRPYADVTAVPASRFRWSSVRVARKYGKSGEAGHLGDVIYSDMLLNTMTAEQYKAMYPYGPEFVIVKEDSDNDYPRYPMPVMFDDDYMGDHEYCRYCFGGWAD